MVAGQTRGVLTSLQKVFVVASVGLTLYGGWLVGSVATHMYRTKDERREKALAAAAQAVPGPVTPTDGQTQQ
ncbi:Hypp6382 [Branchiostoma lanceolatum]|uniref:Hypp6382 protein n=1 Tax=Branchiostoma lanceolatum TaxID=7740 RepID=A0A8J9YU02_BRALA|nr:Hypp6382 [Branchiostoma lanceolatum]